VQQTEMPDAKGGHDMRKKTAAFILSGSLAFAAAAQAQETIKIGLIMPYSG
jgi:hypothetical protein